MAANQISGLQFVLSARIDGLQKGLNQAGKSLQTLEKQTRNVQNLLAGFGVGFGVFQLGRAVSNVIGVFKDFEFTMSEVRAITNATDEGFKKLEADAIRLGRSTVFTAREVGKLQVAYGRLGFSTQEILNATEATLNLAAATNINLAEAAEVAGSTVRGFQLDASETTRVTDVMTSSFNKTALSVDTFRESMKFVAPIAQAANASVEETTALLGVLANAGIKGSIAGTSLRRIFSDLTRDGRPLIERLKELGEKGLTLAGAYDEIGRIAQTSLLVLAKNTDQIENLSFVLNQAAGEAERVANIRLNNLEGDVIRLTSAWEGFLLSVQGSEFYRDFIQSLTINFNLLVGQVNSSATVLQKLTREIRDGGIQVGQYVQLLREAREAAGKPIDETFVESIGKDAKLSTTQLEKLLQIVKEINSELTPSEEAQSKFDLQLKNIGIDPKFFSKTKENFDKIALALNAYTNKLQENINTTNSMIQQGSLFEDEGERRKKVWIEEIEIIEQYVDKLLKSFPKEVITGTNEQIRSLEDLKKARAAAYQEFNEQVDEADIQSKISIGNIIKDLDRQIEKWEAYARTVKKAKDSIKEPIRIEFIDFADLFKQFDDFSQLLERSLTGNILPSFNEAKNSIRDFAVTVEELPEEVDASMQLVVDNLRNKFNQFGQLWRQGTADAVQWVDSIKNAMIDLAPFIANFASDFGEAIGDSVSGFQSFGDGMLRAVSNFMGRLGKQMIDLGIAKTVLDKLAVNLPGGVLIAAGIALVAASKAIGNTLNSGLSSSSSGSRSSSSGSQFAFAQDSSPIRLVAETQIRGQDLYVIFSNYERNNRSTRNG
jgi:hypothetical protein